MEGKFWREFIEVVQLRTHEKKMNTKRVGHEVNAHKAVAGILIEHREVKQRGCLPDICFWLSRLITLS